MKTTYIKNVFMGLVLVLFTACGSGGDSAQDKAIAKIVAYVTEGGPAPTVDDFKDAGAEGVNADNLSAINAFIQGLTQEDVDTSLEIKAIADKFGVTLTGNIPPIAKAYADQTTITEGDTISFNSTLSVDTDGSIVSYKWRDNGNSFAGVPSFSNPSVTTSALSVGTHKIELTVTDNEGATGTDVITVIVTAVEVKVVEVKVIEVKANAGDDQNINVEFGNMNEGFNIASISPMAVYIDSSTTVVNLNGSGSTGNGELTYEWSGTSDSALGIDLSDPEVVNPSFTLTCENSDDCFAPIAAIGPISDLGPMSICTYTFELTIDDGSSSDSDSVNINVDYSGCNIR